MGSVIKKDSLSKRSINAGFWTIGVHMFTQIFRLAGNLIMTRLLVPEMFGVMAIANVFIFGLNLFSDIGLHHNVIQSPRGGNKSFLDTVWTSQIVRGFLIFILGSLLSVMLMVGTHFHWFPSDSVYADAVLPWVLITLSFGAVLGGFESTKTSTASRELELKKIKIVEMVSHVAGIFFMLSWAYFDKSIWALVYGSLFSIVIKVLLSHTVLSGQHNSFHWNKEDFREIFAFGKWIFVSSMIGFLYLTGDRLMLGGIMTIQMFGLYSIAMLIFSTFKELFMKLYGSVYFPAFSEVYRNHPEQLKASYYKFRFVSDALLALCAGCLFATAHLIMNILYDERYQASGDLLQIISLSLISFRYEVTNQCFLAMGKPKLQSFMTIINAAMLFILLPLANYIYGVNAALWTVAIAPLFAIPFVIHLKIKNGIFDWKKEFTGLLFVPVGYVIGLLIVKVFSYFPAVAHLTHH